MSGWVYGGSGGTPGGPTGSIQFNSSGSFSGSILLTTNGAGSISASANISASSFYGDGSNLTGVTASAVNVADGPQFSLQFRKDTPISGEISGSENLHFVTASTDELHLTGNLYVKGNAFIGNGTGGGSIFVLGDTNTRIRFGPNGADSMSIEVGGKRMFLADENGVDRVILGTDSTDSTILSGNLLVCNGTASISHLSGCSNINVLSPMSSSFPISASSFFINGAAVSAGGTPGGATGQVQFNDGGSFGGDADFTWSKSANRLTITGSAHISGSTQAGNDIIVGSGTSRTIGMRKAGDDYFAFQHAAGRILLTSSAGFEFVGGGGDGVGLFGVDGIKVYGDSDGNRLSGSILKSGVISGSSLTVAGAVTAAGAIVGGGNLTINGAISKFNSNVTVTGSTHLSGSTQAGNDIIVGSGTSRTIGMRFAGSDYFAFQHAAGRILLTSSAGFEFVGGGGDGVGLFGVSGIQVYGDSDGNKLSGSILKSGVISGSSLTVSSNIVAAGNATIKSIPANRVVTSTTNGLLNSHSDLTYTSGLINVPAVTSSVGVMVTSSANGSINIGQGISYRFGSHGRLDVFENEFRLNKTNLYQAMFPEQTSNFDIGESQVFLVNTNGSVVTGTLPGVTSADDTGITFTIKDSGGNGGTNNVVIQPSGSQKIDGANQAKIQADYGAMTVLGISSSVNGFGWAIVSTT
jgi:hypothetical protein